MKQEGGNNSKGRQTRQMSFAREYQVCTLKLKESTDSTSILLIDRRNRIVETISIPSSHIDAIEVDGSISSKLTIG